MEIVDYIVAEDKDLVKMSLVGDQVAFGYLFNRYSDAIRRLFLQRYTSVEDTEDLLQETFIKVYINLWVKVKEKWRDSDFVLNSFGYNPKDLD